LAFKRTSDYEVVRVGAVNVIYKRKTVNLLNVAKAWKTMMEKSEDNESNSPEKLLIDDPSNFQFHAAYLTYSEIYDKITSSETKKQLNENLIALQKNQIDYPTFYKNINQYRIGESSPYRHSRSMFIKTQKKQEWRRETQKQERNRRYRK